jgi:tRNA (cytidine/uridine-2'-O-)-methyltransferase
MSQPTEDLHVVLVAPEIHWNTGNAGRTCLAVGARLHLVEPLGFSLDERAVRRAGLDYWPRVPLSVWSSWDACAQALVSCGRPWLFSAEAPRAYTEVAFPRPAVLVFGCESVGLPSTLRAHAGERLLRIPIRDQSVRSLNLSTAVGIAAYEARRQWARDDAGEPGA